MKLSPLLLLVIILAGCASAPVNKQDLDITTHGMLIGNLSNQPMDEADRLKLNNALETTPTNHTTAWTNPDSSTSFQVTPTKTYYHQMNDDRMQPCREFTATAIMGGKKTETYGTACRQIDGEGSWKVIH